MGGRVQTMTEESPQEGKKTYILNLQRARD